MKSRKTKIETVIGAVISTIAAMGLLIFNGFIIDNVQFVNETLAVCIMGFALLYSIIFNEENSFIAKIIPVLTSLYLFVRLGIKPLLSYSINDIAVSVLHAVFYGILFVCFTISIISRLTSNKIDYEKYTILACLIESAILMYLACFKGADSFIMLMPICSLQLFVHMWTLNYEEQKAYEHLEEIKNEEYTKNQ